MSEKIYRVQMNSKGMPNFSTAVEVADRPQGYWTKTDAATYRCSECGKIQIADDINELNFCCCCGSRNKIRKDERSRR